MRQIDVVTTEIGHLQPFAARVRADDAAEAAAIGFDVRRALWRSWRNSVICHTCFVDGEPAAIFGLAGALLDDTGMPWLATTPAIERIKVSFVRYGRAEVALMLQIRPRLVNYVDARYDRAQRFLSALGFALHPPEPYGPNGELFRRFERIA